MVANGCFLDEAFGEIKTQNIKIITYWFLIIQFIVFMLKKQRMYKNDFKKKGCFTFLKEILLKKFFCYISICLSKVRRKKFFRRS